MASKKRSLSDMQKSRLPSKLIDEEAYSTTVLRLPSNVTEDGLDQSLSNIAQELGLATPRPPSLLNGLASSLSATTIGSEHNNQGSVLSQSTGPTSCSSSERRPVTQSSASHLSQKSPTQSITPSTTSDNEKRRGLGFRNGIRRMTGFKKRRSVVSTPSALMSIAGNSMAARTSDRMSMQSGLKSPASIKSNQNTWSSPPSAANLHHEETSLPEDKDAIQPARECKELLDLQKQHLDERLRFLEFHKSSVAHLKVQHNSMRLRMIDQQQQMVRDSLAKVRPSLIVRLSVADKGIQNERAVEDLESRHLEAEMKLVAEFELAKKAIMIRLRHMEAYCQNPSPPPTPHTSASSSNSDERSFPERKVTDKDYHSLAQQYRERDAMETLHQAKIEVLRGRQNKALENFIGKKEKEIGVLEAANATAIKDLEKSSAEEEEVLYEALNDKRLRLEDRWRLQAWIERAKVEKASGFKLTALADTVIGKDTRSRSVSS